MLYFTKIVILFFILSSLVSGQTDTGKIDNFSIGLMTAVNNMKIPPGAASVCHNVDLGDGNLKVRSGYDKVFTFHGIDSVLGVGTLYKADGTQRMFAVVDSTGVGYGNIYASTEGTYEFGSRIDSFYIVPDTSNYPTTPSVAYYKLIVSITGYLTDTICSDTIYNDTIENDSRLPTYSNIRNHICSVMVARLNASGIATYFTMTDHDSAFSMEEKTAYNTSLIDLSYTKQLHSPYIWPLSITQTQISVSTVPERSWKYFPIQSPPRFTQFNDMLYVVPGGDGRGVLIDDGYNGLIAQSYPLPATGEPLVIPIKDTGSNNDYTLDGEYYYTFKVSEVHNDSDVYTAYAFGSLSYPVKVSDGRMLLYKFAEVAKDSVRAKSELGAGDTITVEVWRTKGNPGRITTSSYVHDTKLRLKITDDTVRAVDTASGHTKTQTFTALSSAYLIDSICDTLLGDSGLFVQDTLDGMLGLDSTGVLLRRYGAPGYISGTTKTYGAGDTAGSSSAVGIFVGTPRQGDTLGIYYAVALHDTITGNQGDLSPNLVVWNDEGKNFNKVTIGLPKIASGDSNLIFDLYRGSIYQIGRDTGKTYYLLGHPLSYYSKDWLYEYMDSGYAVDSVVLELPRLMTQLPSTDTVYTDSVRYDSLQNCKTYSAVTPPAILDNVFPFDNYMFGYHNSNLYRSDLDSAYKWSVWNITPVEPDDGDQITAAGPSRTYMRVFKNFSNYIIYEDYSKPQLVGKWGCIAPLSYVSGALRYYLSAGGIVGEADGQVLERTIDQGIISEYLNNFDGLSLSDKKEMVAAYLPTEQKVLFSLNDTTYVYDEKAIRLTGGKGGWSTWGFSFAGGCLYDVEDELDFTPGKTFYFFKHGDSSLYEFGNSITDDGDSIRIEWKSGALYPDRYLKKIEDLGLWVESLNGDDSLIVVYILDETGDTLSTTAYSNLNNARYHLKELTTASPGQYLQIYLVSAKSLANTSINGIDFKCTRVENKSTD